MKVFISYSHGEDTVAARLTEHWLQRSGFLPIRDENKFRSGLLWDQIEIHIRDCDLFLAILTERYYTKNTKRELELARYFERPLLFVSFDGAVPQNEDSERLPHNLNSPDVGSWQASLLSAVRRELELDDNPIPPWVDEWLSKQFNSNKWVSKRSSLENLRYSRLRVGSSIELASRISGWGPKELHTTVSGPYRIEPESDGPLCSKQLTVLDGAAENYALRSLYEDLTDEPRLQLNLERISHDLVRYVGDNFERITSGNTSLRHLFEPGSIELPNSVVVHVAVVSSDGYLVLGHRSGRPRFYENCWSVGYEEHMKVEHDKGNPFVTALRGLREELVGRAGLGDEPIDVRFFSVFRELDRWSNSVRKNEFWVLNIGLAGIAKVPFTIDDIFRTWLDAEDRREFRHVVGVPYTADYLIALGRTDSFDPRSVPGGVRVPVGIDQSFPDIGANPTWTQQHPTNKIRVARCLTADFHMFLQEKMGAWKPL